MASTFEQINIMRGSLFTWYSHSIGEFIDYIINIECLRAIFCFSFVAVGNRGQVVR